LHCSGIKYTIRLPLYCMTNDLIWNWKGLKRLRIQQLQMKADTTDRSNSDTKKGETLTPFLDEIAK
jgi:hypothetical protein